VAQKYCSVTLFYTVVRDTLQVIKFSVNISFDEIFLLVSTAVRNFV